MSDVWVENPPDNSNVKVEILPKDFNTSGFCTMCGGAIDLDFRCTRCNADYWPAIKRGRSATKS